MSQTFFEKITKNYLCSTFERAILIVQINCFVAVNIQIQYGKRFVSIICDMVFQKDGVGDECQGSVGHTDKK